MAQVGSLGDMVFRVSDETVETLSNIKWSGSARYAVHKRLGTHALTEFVGLDPDRITFDIELSAYLGVNPSEEIIKLWGYERSGEPVSLVIGTRVYGKYRWNVVSHSMKMLTHDADGDVTSAKVSVELQEYLWR